MKRICYIACAALLLSLGQGCFLTGDLASDVQKIVGQVELPDSVKAQGRGYARSYIVTQYPQAAPVVDIVLNRLMPVAQNAPPGPPSFIQIPITYTTNLTVQLKDGLELAGSRFVTGSQIESMFVEVKPVLGQPILPEPVTVKSTPGQFASSILNPTPAPVVVPVDPADPVPSPDPADPVDDDELNDNPEIPADL